jgi:hypothetical protein
VVTRPEGRDHKLFSVRIWLFRWRPPTSAISWSGRTGSLNSSGANRDVRSGYPALIDRWKFNSQIFRRQLVLP